MHGTVKVVLRGKFMALNAFIRKEESVQIGYQSSYLKKSEKEEQIKSKARRWQEITRNSNQ